MVRDIANGPGVLTMTSSDSIGGLVKKEPGAALIAHVYVYSTDDGVNAEDVSDASIVIAGIDVVGCGLDIFGES